MATQTSNLIHADDMWRASLESPYGLAQAVRFTAMNTGLSIDALAEAFYLCRGDAVEVTVTEHWIETKCKRDATQEQFCDARLRTTDAQRLSAQTQALLNPDLMAVTEQCEPFLDMSIRESAALLAGDMLLEANGWQSVPDIEQYLELGYVCMARAFYLLDLEYADALFDSIRMHAHCNARRRRCSGTKRGQYAYV